ncbi:MAG: hypothetical protein H6Q59_329 [Firmicutes bacterium]|nr:hypothetical protein [Bacillota bacterium]
MNNNSHITPDELSSFTLDTMTMEEKEKFLEHICSCNHCSDQLAAFMAEDLIPAPRDMKENIMKATRRPEIQIAIKSREVSKRIQLLLYSLKVGTAAVAAIALLLLSMNFQNTISDNESFTKINIAKEDNVPLTDTIRDNMNSISKNILDFSNNIINMEVTENDPKEK